MFGRIFYPNGERYIGWGDYVDTSRNGLGVMYRDDGTVQRGVWEDGLLVETIDDLSY